MKTIRLLRNSIILGTIAFAINIYSLSINNALLPTVHKPVTVMTDHKTSFGRSKITYLKDNTDQRFVLKSKSDKNDDQPHYDQPVRDAVGAYIGNDVQISINKVRIISPDTQLPGMPGKNSEYAASLHEHVPGKELYKFKSDNILCKLRTGQLYFENPDLLKIAVLDVFLNNCDRHSQNLFYNPKSNRYYAIDMDRIYANTQICTNILIYTIGLLQGHLINMPKKTARTITRLMNSAEFKEKKYQALEQFHKTLKELITKYPPSKIYDLWLTFAQQAEYHYSFMQKIIIRAEISRNYNNSKKLLNAIKKVLQTKPQTVEITI